MVLGSSILIGLVILTSSIQPVPGESTIPKVIAGIAEFATTGNIDFDRVFKFDTEMLESDEPLVDETASDHPTVSTTSGDVMGSTLQEAHAFYSIPYAAPPVADLRFRDTQPVVRSTSEINATTPDYLVCPQRPHDECGPGWCYVNQNEDCLVLNVHVPLTVNFTDINSPPIDRLPVLFWIHGGSFFAGTGTSSKTDGRFLSNVTNSIVVVINYRLGAYGFLVYNKGEDRLTGNQGLKDQQMAMRWVQDNIDKFGGDKDRVTILGESAGAQSVMWHLLSGVSQPLFHRAILESNAPVFPHQTPDQAMTVTNRLLRVLNCTNESVEDELECLLNAPSERLNRVSLVMGASLREEDAWSTVEPYRPIIDGNEFTDQPLTLFQDGKWNNEKQFISGANTQEVEILQYFIPSRLELGWSAFLKMNQLFFGEELGNKTANYYDAAFEPDGTDYSKILGIEAGDAFFICPNRAMLRLAYATAENQEGNYFYINGHPAAGKYCEDVMLRPETCGYAYHSSEIPFVFRSGPLYGYFFYENDTQVCDQFSYYWGNFAKTGDPNSALGSIPLWPPYAVEARRENEKITSLNGWELPNEMYHKDGLNTNALRNDKMWPPWVNIRIQAPEPYVEEEYKRDVCDFWDSLNFYVQYQEETTTRDTHGPTASEATVSVTVSSTPQPATTTDAGSTVPLSPLTMSAALMFLSLYWTDAF